MVNALRGQALSQACGEARKKFSASKCPLYFNTESVNKHLDWEIRDIEDLSDISEKHGACAYYFTKERAKSADLILMPYNYLIDEKIRENFEIDYSNSVVIVDEAHNIAGSCEETASMSIKETTLNRAITEMKKLCSEADK